MEFQKEVIERSQSVPVVVDFWAPWCGPCKVLGPIIEELAEQSQEKWVLVKVNSDENPELSTQYKIKGIPAVKMFHRGEVIAEFTGSLPKIQIESWLDENLPDERKDLLSDLRNRLESGEDMVQEIETFVDENPDLDEAKMLLAKGIIFKSTDDALDKIASLKAPHKYSDQIQDIKSLADLMNCATGQSALSDKIEEARTSATKGDFDTALDRLIDVVMVDKGFCNEMPRRATIALFHWLGDQHELTRKHRRRFDMALY